MIETLLTEMSERYECAFHVKQGKHGYYLEHDRNGVLIRLNDCILMVFVNNKNVAYEKNIDHDRIISVLDCYLKKRTKQMRLF